MILRKAKRHSMNSEHENMLSAGGLGGSDPLNEWVLDGNGLDGTGAPGWRFRVSPRVKNVENILPAAVYSHLLSGKQ
ncbi:MAG: hypothetical protein Ct9H300mP7_0100 [Verrucomicrobiota bacterium]|nr:MAG: hypothetical protein Ct9H300mP7_0100 [Verrucomicrobiota bacterium]